MLLVDTMIKTIEMFFLAPIRPKCEMPLCCESLKAGTQFSKSENGFSAPTFVRYFLRHFLKHLGFAIITRFVLAFPKLIPQSTEI